MLRLRLLRPQMAGKMPRLRQLQHFRRRTRPPRTAKIPTFAESLRQSIPLSQIGGETFQRTSSGIQEFDTVLYFEGQQEDNFRLLRAVKNRFGSVQEVGVFEMTETGVKSVTDYADLFLSDNRGAACDCYKKIAF